MNETFVMDGLTFELRRSAKRKTLGLTVDRGGELIAFAPADAPTEEIHEWIQGRLLWAHQKLASKEALQPLRNAPDFVTGETIFYLGDAYPLRLAKASGELLEFNGVRFRLKREAIDPYNVFAKWYQRAGSEVLQSRVCWYKQRTTRRPRGFKVCDLGFRWGSCSARGRLSFNWKIMQLPLRLIDYVVAHELAHLAVPDHSPRFWKVFREIQPDCLERREELNSEAKHYLTFARKSR